MLQEVQSSACAAIGYDAQHEQLTVQYKPKAGEDVGVTWGYHPVSQDVYAAIMEPGASIGSLLHKSVKSNPLITAFKLDEVPV